MRDDKAKPNTVFYCFVIGLKRCNQGQDIIMKYLVDGRYHLEFTDSGKDRKTCAG